MKRQQYFKHRLETLNALHDAIGAMRSLSAHHFRLVRGRLEAARAYRDEIDRVIQELQIRQTDAGCATMGLVVLASDLGLCGDYNTRVLRESIQMLREAGSAIVYAVGRRAQRSLGTLVLERLREYGAPASAAGIPRALYGVVQDVMQDYTSGEIGSLMVVSARFDGVGQFSVRRTRILPVQSSPRAVPAMTSPYVQRDHLRRAAVREFLYISLYERVLDALAAEHGMRLTSAEAAIEWLENTREHTARRLAAVRSEASTQELLDIVSGSRKLRKG